MPPRSPGLFSDPEPTSDRPAGPAILAHCDGGARGNPGPSGYGVEITDAHGTVLAELSEFLGIRTNNFAEYAGLLASLHYALDQGHRELLVISDSLLMVKQIQGAYKVKSPDLIPLWQEAKRRIAKLDRFEIAHALRHKNKAADRLANQAMDRGMHRNAPAEGRPLIQKPDPRMASTKVSQSGVQSLPLRAVPYPQPNSAPPTPATLDPAPRSAPTRSTHAPIILAPEPAQPSAPPPAPKAVSAPEEPATPTMLRGFTRDGAIHLLGSDKLPNGIFVKVIPE